MGKKIERPQNRTSLGHVSSLLGPQLVRCAMHQFVYLGRFTWEDHVLWELNKPRATEPERAFVSSSKIISEEKQLPHFPADKKNISKQLISYFQNPVSTYLLEV